MQPGLVSSSWQSCKLENIWIIIKINILLVQVLTFFYLLSSCEEYILSRTTWLPSSRIPSRTFINFWASSRMVNRHYGQIYILLGTVLHWIYAFPLHVRCSSNATCFRLQEVKSQPQNIVLDYILLEDPWTRAFRYILKWHVPHAYEYIILIWDANLFERRGLIVDICRDVLKKYDYVKIRSQRLQGLVLNAFCLRKHLTRLRLIEAHYTKTGFGGMWVRGQCVNEDLHFANGVALFQGNKGAVSVRMNAYGVSVCVVNSHLTPHDHLLADRIADYNTIVTDHTFTVLDTSKILYHEYGHSHVVSATSM